LPLKVYLYANSWLAENTQFALLLGRRVRPAGGAFKLLRPDDQIGSAKSLLLGIKNNQFYVVYQPVVNAQTLRSAALRC
jgi:sensor c-di-GMP phosphodiesterase-like protein